MMSEVFAQAGFPLECLGSCELFSWRHATKSGGEGAVDGIYTMADGCVQNDP